MLGRVVRKVPDAVEAFVEKAPALLTDRHHGVLLAGTTLMLELCRLDPAMVATYRRQARALLPLAQTLLRVSSCRGCGFPSRWPVSPA